MIYKLKYENKYLSNLNPIEFDERGLTWSNMRDLKSFIRKNKNLLSEYEEKLEAIGFDAITLLKYKTLLKEIKQVDRRRTIE